LPTMTTHAFQPISSVERETGIAKDTLRAWERRYGFPAPLRDETGERRYPDAQVRKLHVIHQLMELGLRPGKLLHQTVEELKLSLRSMADSRRTEPELRGELREIMDAVHSYSSQTLRAQLNLALLGAGLRGFLTEFVEPLNAAIGDAWARGELAISQEHLYSEQIQIILRRAIDSVPAQADRPRILLTTLPGEEHQLGLLMAQACLALEGALCISLGIQTPIGEVQRAVMAHRADIVGLSFGHLARKREARENLMALRNVLTSRVQIWAGGKLWQDSRTQWTGITLISALTDIPTAVATWRADRLESRSTRI
jgi:MerR family transcriptional regulator, light-induced transcriptional regulator